MNSEKAIFEEARNIIADRVNHYKNYHLDNLAFGSWKAYESCLDILECALNGDWENLKEFDYYED